MKRIEGIDPKNAGLFTRLVYAVAKRKVAKLTGRGEVIEPVKVLAKHPRILVGMAQLDAALDKSKAIPSRYKSLAMYRVAGLIGCPF